MSEVWLLLPLMFLSHAGAALGFARSLRRGIFPRATQVIPASFILYYDLGLVAELLDYPYEMPWFPSVFKVDEATQAQTLGVLIVAPWLVLAGAWLVGGRDAADRAQPLARIVPSRSIACYSFLIVISFALAAYGFLQIRSGANIWDLRRQIGQEEGALSILRYLPLHFIAFFVATYDARTKVGTALLAGLVVASSLTTLAIGQRTTLLLPLIIILCFRFRITKARLLAGATALSVAAALMLTYFKDHYSTADLKLNQLIANTIHTDFSRTGTLITAMDMAEPWGTNVLPYPGSGYAHCFLFPFPRDYVEFKGHPTGFEFTARLLGEHAHELRWNLAIGMLEDILLNLGKAMCLPMLVLYGVLFGLLDRLSVRIPSLAVSMRMGAVFICGYDLTAFVFWYGTMAITGIALHGLFAYIPRRATSESARPLKFYPAASSVLRSGTKGTIVPNGRQKHLRAHRAMVKANGT